MGQGWSSFLLQPLATICERYQLLTLQYVSFRLWCRVLPSKPRCSIWLGHAVMQQTLESLCTVGAIIRGHSYFCTPCVALGDCLMLPGLHDCSYTCVCCWVAVCSPFCMQVHAPDHGPANCIVVLQLPRVVTCPPSSPPRPSAFRFLLLFQPLGCNLTALHCAGRRLHPVTAFLTAQLMHRLLIAILRQNFLVSPCCCWQLHP